MTQTFRKNYRWNQIFWNTETDVMCWNDADATDWMSDEMQINGDKT
jgi:hypothetical protein